MQTHLKDVWVLAPASTAAYQYATPGSGSYCGHPRRKDRPCESREHVLDGPLWRAVWMTAPELLREALGRCGRWNEPPRVSTNNILRTCWPHWNQPGFLKTLEMTWTRHGGHAALYPPEHI